MFGLKAQQRAAQHDQALTYHVVLTDRIPDGATLDLAGEMSRDAALALFDQRVAKVGYPPHGPVRLRVVDHAQAVTLLGGQP